LAVSYLQKDTTRLERAAGNLTENALG